MKIKCTNCGKRFNYELYAGLCPHCGVYMRQDTGSDPKTEPSSPTIHTPGKVSTDSRPGLNPDAKTAQMTGSAPTRNTSSDTQHFHKHPVITFLLILILIFIIVVPIAFSSYTNRIKTDTLTLSETSVSKNIRSTEAIPISTENGRFKISFLSVSPDTDKAFETPDGYEILAVRYHVEVPPEALAAYPGQADENQLYTNWDYGTVLAYGVTKSGSYLKPVSEYDLSHVKNLDYEDEKNSGIGDTIDSQEGSLYFMVKKKDFKGLLINEINPDTEALSHSYFVTWIKRQKLQKK